MRHHFLLPINSESGCLRLYGFPSRRQHLAARRNPFFVAFGLSESSCIVIAPVSSEDYKYHPAFPRIPRIADSSFWLRQLWNSLISRRAAQDPIIAAECRRILVRRAASIIMWPHKSLAKTGLSPNAKVSGHYQADESDREVAVAECNATVNMTVSLKADT